MADLLTWAASSHRLQLLATAVLSGVAAAVLVLAYHHPPDREGRRGGPDDDDGRPAPSREDARAADLARRAQTGDFDEDLILEQLARNRVFLADDGLSRVRAAFVVVVGCGGVGGHCAAALARSGVSRIRLIDFDQVTLSSLNRHAVATLADVGVPKVECLRRRLVQVAPWARFDVRLAKFDAHVADEMLGRWEEQEGEGGGGGGDGQMPDFVVDAIDNIDTKVALLKSCHDRSLPVIASMGAGCKSDPTRVVVGDIANGTYDRLSRSTRRRLKLLGITAGIPTVYSTEQWAEGKAALIPIPEEEFQKGSVDDLSVMPNFRVRILPVLGTMPAVFGYTIANHIILSVAGYPTDYVPARSREKMYDSCLAFLQGSEERLGRALAPDARPDVAFRLKIPITTGDVAFLVEELYRGRSAVTGVPTKLVLVRWQKPAPEDGGSIIRIGEGEEGQRSSTLRLRDLVCMTKEEAVRHEREVLTGDRAVGALYDQETVDRISARVVTAAEYEIYRDSS